MNRMIKKLLAAVLVTSMLLGSNGISFSAMAAEADSITGTEEAAQEAGAGEQKEETETAENSGAGLEESTEEVEQVSEEDEEVLENVAEEIHEEPSEAEDISGQDQAAEDVSAQDSAAEDASEQESAAGAEEDAEEAGSEADSQENAEEAAVDETTGQEGEEQAEAEEDPLAAEEQAGAEADPLAAEEQAAAETDPLAAEEQAQEQVFTAGELVCHGTDYDVTLAYDEKAKIPAAVELKVREIEKGTPEYESYLRGAEAAAGKGVAEARFFDITIWAAGADGQQQEIQPQSQVRVNITYHKAIEVASEGEVQAMHFENGTADAEVVGTDTNGGSEVSEIAFDAESFSVYGIVYTVDFTYDGFTYSMPGEGSIYLSELAEILGLYETDLDKAFSIDNVSNVTFTNYDLVNVEKQADGDWLLTSLAPFTSEETLTITMNDGVTFIVDVTDAAMPSSNDLRDFITAVTIDAPVNEDGEYMVTPGTGYKISFSLAEGAGLQFDNTALTYSIPSGLNADGQEGTFSVTIEKDGQSYVIAGNTYKIENDTLTVTWNKNSGNYDKLTAAGNVKFWLYFEGDFDESASEIVFSDGITKKIEIDNSSSVTASKSAAVDLANKKVNYTVAVTSTGNSTNVRIEDTITADTEGVLTLDLTSIKAESSKTGEVGFVKNVEGNSFSCVIDSMRDGEVVTLTYSADIDTSKIPVDVNNNPTVVIGNNRVKVSNEYDPTPVEREVNTRIDYTPKIQKDGMVLNEDGETFDCRFTFNTDAAYSGANHQITDTLGEYLTLEGTTGARITIIDSEGSSTQQFLNWGESNPNFGTLNKSGGNDSFVYITPNIPGEYKYIVEYQVKVTGTEGLVEQITVSNTVQTDGDKNSTGTGTYTPATGELKLYKTADKIDYENKKVTWTVSIDVPETGLTEAYAELVDKLPQSGWIDEISGSAWDTFVQDSETVTGLIGTESYTLVNDPANHTFTVKFINSSGEPGLDAGQKRVVRVTFKTAIDPNWLDAAKTRSWLANHVNNVELGTKTGSASVVIAGAGVTKTGELCGYRTVNGTRLPIYRFRLLLKNVTKDDNTIKDTFDRELLEPLYVDQLESTEGLTSDDKWYGWHTTNENMSGVRSSSAVSYVDTPYGMDIITSADSMVHNSLTTTGFYEVTRIDYFLTVKDAAALKKIQDLAYADEDNKYTFNNKAEWEDNTGDVDVTYEFKGLKKELLTPDDQLIKTDENVTVQFRITLNPGGQTLNGGEPMTMTDTVTNLSVDVSTIQASPSAGVSWDMTGNTVTYVIPDSTQVVITYSATVIFDTIGEQGETVDSTFSNVAEMKGYNDKIEKTAYRKNNGGGSGSVLNIHLLKYKKGDMTKTLQGAKFALLDADKNPIQDKDGNNVTFETDENGLITVEGDAHAHGWTLFADTDYYLKEIKAPEGFVLKNTYYKFIISEDGLPDYDKNIYFSGDTMTCKNEKPGATLEVEKALGEGSKWPEDEIVVFTLERVTEGAPMPESGGETVILSAPGKGTFGEIEYPVSDKEQTFEYKITETDGFGEGWTISGDITATVVVSPDDGSGNVTTTVTYSPENKTITNTFGETTEVEVDKVWANADGSSTWPEGVEVTFQLKADGEEVPGKTLTLTAAKTSGKFEKLPKYQADGKTEIKYSVKEAYVAGYSSVASALKDGKITVTNTQETTEIEVDKKWVNADGSDTWPDGVTVDIQLTAGNTPVTGKTATLSASKPSHKFEKLPKYDSNGIEIKYSVKESEVPGYSGFAEAVADGKITITNTQGATQIEVEKKWVNADGTDTWPTGVTVEIQLTADGTDVSGKTATLSADQTSYTFDKLPKYKADGKTEIAYSVKEVEVAGYTSDVGDLTDGKVTVTNTYGDTTEIEVDKKWINAEDQSVREWPEGVTVEIQLLADGTAVEGKKAKLSAEQPSYKFEKLPKYQSDGKTEIVYSIEEPTKIAGYTSSVEEKEARKFTVTNAYSATGTLNLEAEKKFKNGKLKEGEFTFELMDADGKVLQSKTNDAAGKVAFDEIEYKLSDVTKAPFTYTVREVPGSRADVKYDATVYTVTVELKDKGDGTLEVTKKIDNGGTLKFENEQLNVETSITLGGVKVLKGKDLKAGQFKFVMMDENGKWIDSAENDADGNFTFKPITYKLSDLGGEKTKVFTYGISEVKGSESGIIYDKKVYTVKVTVTNNGDGTMTAKADLARGDIKFVNTTSDKTGDEAPLGVLFGGLGISAAGLVVLLEDRKRRNRNKK